VKWIIAKIKSIMLVSGVLTCTMVYAVIAPQSALRSMFGTTLEGPLAEIIVRNWGALIALIGALLIYGAFHAAQRATILVVAALSKAIFIALVLTFGTSFLHHQVGISIAVDSVMVVLFAGYLLGMHHDSPTA
jgi:hypothetical protein